MAKACNVCIDKTKPYVVWFMNEQNVRLPAGFDSPYLAKVFAEKCRRSKRVKLLSEPLYQ